MYTLAEKFFSAVEGERIREAVARAEAKSAGEIVVLVLPASHPYPEARLRAALLLALPPALFLAHLIGAALWLPEVVLWLFLPIFFAGVLLLRPLVPLVPRLFRRFIPPETAKREVEREAILRFYTEKLHHTRRATGVLIFLSVLEQRVWILGDRGIDAVLPQGVWQDLVRELSEGIRARRQGEATVQAVERIGAMLAEHFPPDPDDSNELEDLLIKDQRDSAS